MSGWIQEFEYKVFTDVPIYLTFYVNKNCISSIFVLYLVFELPSH